MNNPPFCPNARCANYLNSSAAGTWYKRDGTYESARSGHVQRYLCKSCGKKFSDQTYNLDYAVKLKLPYKRIMEDFVSCSGVRAMARKFGVSHKVITNRIGRLSRQGVAIHAALKKQVQLKENLVVDGFESFVVSQYFPLTLHLLAGKDSQFLYGIDMAHMRRKGSQSAKQREVKTELYSKIESGFRTVRTSFDEITRQLADLMNTSDSKSVRTVFSDKHPVYPMAFAANEIVSSLMNAGSIRHITISSRKARNKRNRLFAVNYLERQIRKDCAEHVRETTRFGRNVNNSLERIMVYRLYHNFFKPFRISEEKNEKRLHGEVAGIARSEIEREVSTAFTERRFLRREGILFAEAVVWLRFLMTPLKRWADSCPAYAWA